MREEGNELGISESTKQNKQGRVSDTKGKKTHGGRAKVNSGRRK